MPDKNNIITAERSNGADDQQSRSNSSSSKLESVFLLDSLYWHRRHLCAICVQIGGDLLVNGTGFLVGPDLILTNYHVIEDQQDDPSDISCRFDYDAVGPDSSTMGEPIVVTKIINSSTYSEAEKRREYDSSSNDYPNLDELDYALLKLDREIGKEPFKTKDGENPRGWIGVTKDKPSVHKRSKVYILQHAAGEPLQTSDGPLVEEQPSQATRIRYLTKTLLGSSGSPCFQFTSDPKTDLAVVALHNYGDPNWGKDYGDTPKINHGVPIELIVQDLKNFYIDLPKATEHLPSSLITKDKKRAGIDTDGQTWRSKWNVPTISAIVISAAALILFALAYPTSHPQPTPECDRALKRADQAASELAVEQYRQAAKVCPSDDPRPASREAAALFKRRDYANSAKMYQNAFEIMKNAQVQSKSAKANMLMGKAYALEGLEEFSAARNSYVSARSFTDPSSDFYKFLTFSEGRTLTNLWLPALRDKNRRKLAIKLFQKYIDQGGPATPWAHYYLACLKSTEASVDNAQNHLIEAIRELKNNSASSRIEREIFLNLVQGKRPSKSEPLNPPYCAPLVKLEKNEYLKQQIDRLSETIQ